MAHWVGKFYAKLFPEILPLHGRGPKWIPLVGGPGDGRKFKLTLRVGDTLSLPVATKLDLTALRLHTMYSHFQIAQYRLENVKDDRGRVRLTGVYKGMRE